MLKVSWPIRASLVVRLALLFVLIGCTDRQRIGGQWELEEPHGLSNMEPGPPRTRLVRKQDGTRYIVGEAIEQHRYYNPDCVIFETAARWHEIVVVCGNRAPIPFESSSATRWELRAEGPWRRTKPYVENGRWFDRTQYIPIAELIALAQRQAPFREDWSLRAKLDLFNPPIEPVDSIWPRGGPLR